ncbi:hypothetical protein GQ53DRAFT_789663 [Thozetella sp. PMI_491]|nr:hypothetical protein GQ53DRAFT_789663 [Thozetella sp. PMI_491]
MPFSKRDTELYRRDQKYNHKLLTPEERVNLLKPYLPKPPKRSSPSRQDGADSEEQSRLGVRRFLRTQFHILVFTIIHAIFSLYIRIRQAYHVVGDRIHSVFYYHHRTPELIERDVKGFRRLPTHLSVILSLEGDHKGGAELERLVNEAADIAAWCASAGIPQLSIYEKTGVLKGYVPETHRAITRKLAAYFGPKFPGLSLSAPHIPAVTSAASPQADRNESLEPKHLSVLLISAGDGRDSIVDLTKTLSEMAQRSKISSSDITTDLVDAELSESVMGEPDLLILFGPYVELSSYPPWQIRLTEIFHVRDNHGVGYQDMTGFAPPLIRSGANVLNRALFTRTFDLAAATLSDNKKTLHYKSMLQNNKELLKADRLICVVAHPDKELAGLGKKCLLLRRDVKAEDPQTWGPALKDGVEKNELGVIPYKLELGYDYWPYYDIMKSILPEEFYQDIPNSFNTAGHVAHLNLRNRFAPYKKIVAEVLIDKMPNIQTVINKTNDVGEESEFRTFQYEHLAGSDDLNVKVIEHGCLFEFDYSKVYWNSRLETEHARLVKVFQPGEVVCDVMAGIGPFAIPAGKKGVLVWANDMNPESYASLQACIKRNKVSQFVRPFNRDGRNFIQEAVDSVLQASQNGEVAQVPVKAPRKTNPPATQPEPKPIPIPTTPIPTIPIPPTPIPPTISHFVMNLPASAITFLKHYRGVYRGQEALFEPATETKLPMVHVYCFARKLEDDTPIIDILERITAELGYPVRLGDPEKEGEVSIYDVRDVSPKKRMFCASFRLPREVAFARRD